MNQLKKFQTHFVHDSSHSLGLDRSILEGRSYGQPWGPTKVREACQEINKNSNGHRPISNLVCCRKPPYPKRTISMTGASDSSLMGVGTSVGHGVGLVVGERVLEN